MVGPAPVADLTPFVTVPAVDPRGATVASQV